MRFSVIVAAAALAAATPALAQGPRAEVHTGWDRISAGGVDEDGIAYGVALGYDMTVGTSLFVGVEGDADFANTKKCISGVCVKTGRDLSALLRVGADVGGTTKVYALGGYANGRLRATGLGGANGDGVRVGAGVQTAIGSKLYGKAEYRYTNYEDGVSRNQVLVGLGVQF